MVETTEFVKRLRCLAGRLAYPPDAEDVFEACDRLEQQQKELEKHRWIPISERLPERDKSQRSDSEQSNWVHITDGKQILEAFYYYKENSWEGCYGIRKDTITHWKPIILPEQAKAEEFIK